MRRRALLFLLVMVPGALPLAAQPRVHRILKRHDYVPPPNTPFPDPTYNGGPLVANAAFWMVYWGGYWTSGLGLQQRQHFDSFVESTVAAPGWAAQFAEYQEPAQPIGPASFAGDLLMSGEPGLTVDDSTLNSQIGAWIDSGALPVPDANTVFTIMLPQGTDETQVGLAACGGFLGYHYAAASPLGSFGRYRYIVLPYPDCGGDPAADGVPAINGMTDTLSHEMAETMTDPDGGYANFLYGWFDNNTGNELADICVDTAATLGFQNFWYQKIWSNQASTCIGPTSGASAIHLTVSQYATVDPGFSEDTGAVNVLAGFPATLTLTTDSTQPLSLSVSGPPAGVTYNLSQPTVSATSSATLAISAGVSTGPSGMGTIAATLGDQSAAFQFLVAPWIAVSNVQVSPTAGGYTIQNTGTEPIGPAILLAFHGLASEVQPYIYGPPSTFAPTGQQYSETGPTGDFFVHFPDGMLAPGQSVSQNVGFYNPFSQATTFTAEVFQVLAGNACDLSQNGTNVNDVQLIVNQVLGAYLPAADLNSDGAVTIVDVELVVNAALGLGCTLGN